MEKTRLDVGFVGCGKLGLPVALAIENSGHDVTVYDTNPDVEAYINSGNYPFQEVGVNELLKDSQITVAKSIGEVVAKSDLIFLPIQTPHDPKYEGTTPIPDDRKDFDYRYLENALAAVSNECAKLATKKTVAVISTCLPGTYEGRLKEVTNEFVDYVYTPQFIAMGTVIEDYLHPEFNLIGVESEEAADQLERFYATINNAPNIRTDITTAEGIKVSYNTWITAKTVVANAWGEMAHKTGMNFDDILKAWKLSTRRIISPQYMDSGVSDGGGCHPRDNIALSHIAKRVGMSHNIWEDLMAARQEHMGWLAELTDQLAEERNLPVVILGRAFKPETNIEVGSPSILLSNLMKTEHDHVNDYEPTEPGIYVIGTNNERYKDIKIPEGSIVIDPFRQQPEREGVETIRIGGKL